METVQIRGNCKAIIHSRFGEKLGLRKGRSKTEQPLHNTGVAGAFEPALRLGPAAVTSPNTHK